ncbi:aldehyde dehydrogenase family protein [Planosporangium flavigriseum]|uniref:aldehyde dehydrogenase family protein n=1 Tax=Planosporangium flavigriseum TaxID=373681 RepID=UPI00143A41C3|nr:aldehyde dehydrogenase family protein [Planosporangium flavigriseum]NJC67526.1 aldehyde dehydrogenase family protein [Planosporangium flavigriseum]
MTSLAPPPTRTDGRSLFIGGSWLTADAVYERFNPADLAQLTGTYALATPDHVRTAYDAAAAAFPGWAATPAPERANVLRRAADLLEARVDEATRRLTADMGKALRDARGEVLRSCAILRYFSGELLQPSGETYPSADPSTTLLTIEEPLGVVCAITPWNFPSAIPVWKLAPAIGFGNTVVWKPAEAASGSAVLLTEVLAAAGLPDGVLNLVTGKGSALSGALTGDPRLAALTFTGSGGVGTRLRQAVADRNVKVQLELGGKNPAVVLADADLEDAAVQIVRGAMLSTGQRCTATSRVYVERSAAPRLRELLRARVAELVVGDPFDEATDVGPLASAEQRDTVASYLKLARDEQVEVVVGGSVPDDGSCFVSPTVLAGVRPDSRLVCEEIFGPVLVLEEVDDFDAALAAANDTEFGLSSGLFTRDLGKAMAFVRRTQSGLVHVNRETAGVEPHVPFGGVKGSSSMAREQGKAARQFFTTTKTVYLRTT